jgi:hypothetical protein
MYPDKVAVHERVVVVVRVRQEAGQTKC